MIISLSKTKDNTSINLDVATKKFEDLTALSQKIEKKYPNSKVIITKNNDLSL